ncbi:unnamed protein product, partial [Rotaria sp. Silwood1]
KYYDFILKTDVDVFITTQFAKYVPLTNITLLVGRGGYSTKFSVKMSHCTDDIFLRFLHYLSC